MHVPVLAFTIIIIIVSSNLTLRPLSNGQRNEFFWHSTIQSHYDLTLCIITDQNVVLQQNTTEKLIVIGFWIFPFFHHFLFVWIMIFEPYNFGIERNQITFWNEIDIFYPFDVSFESQFPNICLSSMYIMYCIGLEFILVISGNSKTVMTEIHSDRRSNSNIREW